MILLKILTFMFWLQRELATVANMVIKLYYENVPLKGDKSLAKMEELIKKAMEQVRKEHYLAFCKYFPICDLGLGIEFL
jgi:hypothetical protein